MGLVNCTRCGKQFYKHNKHINENLKIGQKFYCSLFCQYLTKNKQVTLHCDNPKCNKEFKKQRTDVTSFNFCSRSCAVTINNTKFPKRSKVIWVCNLCDANFTDYKKYCSLECRNKAKQIPK